MIKSTHEAQNALKHPVLLLEIKFQELIHRKIFITMVVLSK